MHGYIGSKIAGVVEDIAGVNPCDVCGRIVSFSLDTGVDLAGLGGDHFHLNAGSSLKGRDNHIQIVGRSCGDQYQFLFGQRGNAAQAQG